MVNDRTSFTDILLFITDVLLNFLELYDIKILRAKNDGFI